MLIVGFAQWLPNAADFYLPMLLRFIALFGTAMLYETIRRRLAENASVLVPLRLAVAIAAFAGASWASLVIPVFLEPALHPASYIVTAGVFISVALVITSTAAIKRISVPFALGFLGTFLSALFFTTLEMALWLGIGLTFVMGAIGVFAIGAARQRREAADLLIENQLLTEDLEEALANAEFLAVRDPLTGLYNRRALFEDRLYEGAPGDRHHVMIVDLDNFKQVNDRYGHDMGDKVLIRVADVFREVLRDLPGEAHFAARLGGEEFAVFLGMDNDAAADRTAAALKGRIADAAAGLGLSDGLATASIGLTHMNRGEGIGDALQRADNALYGAKQGGRNRVRRETA
ncbi:GGDEF domain-containing protein [Qipengyuania flava]|uniref:GGDEF domain-containing protein n=1 Tax=Qipengyuania flava TaxID=192812 RepID=UPI001C62AC0B|nr:GGDEF domain-containing protein [Qipengyuania flava]QYJ06409.1 GGDEF domain-containing protein [Qipengyuania flava]